MTLDRHVLRPRRRVRVATLVRIGLLGAVLAAVLVDRRAGTAERDRLAAELSVAKAKQRVAKSAAQLDELAARASRLPVGDQHVTLSHACIDDPLAKDCM
jgi:hypothetical protein